MFLNSFIMPEFNEASNEIKKNIRIQRGQQLSL